MIYNYILYLYYRGRCRIRRKHIKRSGTDKYYSAERRYAGGKLLTAENASETLQKLVLSNEPIFCGRFGATEMLALSVFDIEIKSKYNEVASQMRDWSGFFSNDYDQLKRFSELMKDSIKLLDYLAVWNLSMEEYYIKKYAKQNLAMSRLRFLEPWYSENPWTKCLKGKKVLVIHPFTDTIRNQYGKREYLFDNPDILPEFELLTLKAVQTISGNRDPRFETWFDALDYMFNEAMKLDFDVALIGCDAYGFPLVAKLKKAGKKAIHMGGVLQVLFGIKGSRWDNDPVVSSLYNQYWVRPAENEKPSNYGSVENGCYW
ncbi:MAG: hypothetical protein LUG23_05190 [Oscillospiraceae bacterium]|nr:hypothetical protein [Oscillospiraceae bacterium]